MRPRALQLKRCIRNSTTSQEIPLPVKINPSSVQSPLQEGNDHFRFSTQFRQRLIKCRQGYSSKTEVIAYAATTSARRLMIIRCSKTCQCFQGADSLTPKLVIACLFHTFDNIAERRKELMNYNSVQWIDKCNVEISCSETVRERG